MAQRFVQGQCSSRGQQMHAVPKCDHEESEVGAAAKALRGLPTPVRSFLPQRKDEQRERWADSMSFLPEEPVNQVQSTGKSYRESLQARGKEVMRNSRHSHGKKAAKKNQACHPVDSFESNDTTETGANTAPTLPLPTHGHQSLQPNSVMSTPNMGTSTSKATSVPDFGFSPAAAAASPLETHSSLVSMDGFCNASPTSILGTMPSPMPPQLDIPSLCEMAAAFVTGGCSGQNSSSFFPPMLPDLGSMNADEVAAAALPKQHWPHLNSQTEPSLGHVAQQVSQSVLMGDARTPQSQPDGLLACHMQTSRAAMISMLVPDLEGELAGNEQLATQLLAAAPSCYDD